MIVRGVFRNRPWLAIVALMVFLLVLSLSFLVVALRNPPDPLPEDDLAPREVGYDAPRGQTAQA